MMESPQRSSILSSSENAQVVSSPSQLVAPLPAMRVEHQTIAECFAPNLTTLPTKMSNKIVIVNAEVKDDARLEESATPKIRIGVLPGTYSPMTSEHAQRLVAILNSGVVDQILVCPYGDEYVLSEEALTRQQLAVKQTSKATKDEQRLAVLATVLMLHEQRCEFVRWYVEHARTDIIPGEFRSLIQIHSDLQIGNPTNFFAQLNSAQMKQLFPAATHEIIVLLEADSFQMMKSQGVLTPSSLAGNISTFVILPFNTADQEAAPRVRQAYSEVAVAGSDIKEATDSAARSQSSALTREEECAPDFAKKYTELFKKSFNVRKGSSQLNSGWVSEVTSPREGGAAVNRGVGAGSTLMHRSGSNPAIGGLFAQSSSSPAEKRTRSRSLSPDSRRQSSNVAPLPLQRPASMVLGNSVPLSSGNVQDALSGGAGNSHMTLQQSLLDVQGAAAGDDAADTTESCCRCVVS